MTALEAFGPNLRRIRLRRGISLDELSARTNVSAELWEAMEHEHSPTAAISAHLET